MESVIAEKYAKALFEAAQGAQVLDAVGTELAHVRQAVESHGELRNLMNHPRMDREEKLKALTALSPAKPTPIFEKFLALLIAKKRMKELGAVADGYERLQFKSKGRAVARVVSAAPLASAQKEALAKKLAALTGLTVELREETKPSLVGGMVVYLGDQRLDASVLGQLEKLKQSLLA